MPVRASIRASRDQILVMAATALLAGSALAAATVPAQAAPAPAPANVITLSPVASQLTNPLSTVISSQVTATETVPTATLTFTVTGLPTGLTYTQTAGPGDAALTIAGTITIAGVYRVTVTAADDLSVADTVAETFSWTAKNTIKVTAKAPKKIYLRVTFTIQPMVTDSDPAQKVTWSVPLQHPLPLGLSIDPATGLISGSPLRLGAPPTTVIATDTTGSTGTVVLNWVVSVDGFMFNPGTQTTTAGQGMNLVLGTIDYVPGDKVTWTASGLPAGMVFQQATKMIYGWPTSSGTYHVTLTGYGSRGTYDIMTFKLVVKPAADKGANGQIRLALDGKCLQDPGGRTANGTRVQIENCAIGATEHWTVASDATMRVNGRCLDIAGAGSASGRQLQLWTCGNASARQILVQGSDGELVNPASGLCVTDPGSSRKNGTVPTMGACHAMSYEQWTLPSQPILAAVGGSCADDHFSAGTNGSVVDMFLCNGTRGQGWAFHPDGTIRAGIYGDKCVTVRGTLGKAGTKIVLWACSAGNKAQRWTVTRTGGLSSELSLGGVCLGVPSMTAANATQLITAACTASDPRVHWHIW